MDDNLALTVESLNLNKESLANLITRLNFEAHPLLEKKYGRAGREKCKEDNIYHLGYLAEAIGVDSSELFSYYLGWAREMLKARNIPEKDLTDTLHFIEEACRQLLPAVPYTIVKSYIQNGISGIQQVQPQPSYFNEDNPLLSSAKKYLTFLLDGERKEAMRFILDLIIENHSIADVYEYIFQVTQYEVGRLWQTNKITVAHEHYCTAATQQIMSTLYTYIFNTEKKNLKLLACSISGDLHEIGIRMLSDYFELQGWDTYYMGANMPDANIITTIIEQRPALLALSVTMPLHLSRARGLINKIRSDKNITSLKIIVGGFPFNIVSGLSTKIGADGSATGAKEAFILANHLLSKNQ